MYEERAINNNMINLKKDLKLFIVTYYYHTLLSLSVLLFTQALSTYTMTEVNSKISNLQDIFTPFGVPLSGVYKR